MADHTAYHLTNLTSKDTIILARHLSKSATSLSVEKLLHSQKIHDASLPSSLREPHAMLKIFRRREDYSAEAKHCHSHQELNIELIEEICTLVQEECTTYLQPLLGPIVRSPVVERFVLNMQELATLWAHASGNSPKCLIYGSETCKACILTHLSSSPERLSVLRSSLLGRSRRYGPPLLSLIDAWIEMLGKPLEVRYESDLLASEIRLLRRQYQKMERESRAQARKQKTAEEETAEHTESERSTSWNSGSQTLVKDGVGTGGVAECQNCSRASTKSEQRTSSCDLQSDSSGLPTHDSSPREFRPRKTTRGYDGEVRTVQETPLEDEWILSLSLKIRSNIEGERSATPQLSLGSCTRTETRQRMRGREQESPVTKPYSISNYSVQPDDRCASSRGQAEELAKEYQELGVKLDDSDLGLQECD